MYRIRARSRRCCLAHVAARGVFSCTAHRAVAYRRNYHTIYATTTLTALALVVVVSYGRCVVVTDDMPRLRSYVTVLGSFFEYDTAKVVHIPSKKVGIINRVIQATIVFYIVL